MIGKRLVKHALTKYGIPFDFPINAKTGTVIVCWQDLWYNNGDTERLLTAIMTDDTCLLTATRGKRPATLRLK